MGDHWTERLQRLSAGLAGSSGLGLGGAIAAIVIINPAVSAAVLTGWSFEPTQQALSIVLPPGVTPRFLVFAEPARIVLEIPQTQLGPITTLASYAGPVRQVQVIQQSADVVHIVLELAPNTVIDRRHAELTSSAAGNQTRWTLTPLIVDGPALPIASVPEPTAPAVPEPAAPVAVAPAESAETPAAADVPVPAPAVLEPAAPVAVAPAEPAAEPAAEPPVAVDLPVPVAERPVPAASASAAPTRPLAQPPVGPRFIDGPEGQLSIRASNLMLPLPGDRLADLPNTLPLDPFATSFAPATQVSVPPLEGAVAITPNPPQVTVPAPAANPVAPAAAEIAVAPPGQQLPAAPSQPGQPNPAPNLPASVPLTPGSLAVQPLIEVAPPSQPPVASAAADVAPSPAPSPASGAAPIATAIAVPPPAAATADSPPFLSSPAQSAGDQPIAAAPPTAGVPSLAPGQLTPASAPPSAAIAVAPPAANPPATAGPAAVSLTVSPPPFLAAPAIAPTAAASAADPLPPVLLTPPPTAPEPVPFVVSPSSAPVLTSPPPDAVIAFGQPLPEAAAKEDLPSFPYLATPASSQQPIGADVLIPAGTLLPLRYDGSEPLQLDQQGRVTVPLQLERELRDAKTGAVIAPAGSQILGEFGPDEMGLRWVSQTLILPGREVALESASAYLSGPPQVAGQSLAVNSGIGALALTVLTGFSGVGLVGGALLGATAAVGMAPQTIVIEPHQIIQVQVLTDVPRSALRLQ